MSWGILSVLCWKLLVKCTTVSVPTTHIRKHYKAGHFFLRKSYQTFTSKTMNYILVIYSFVQIHHIKILINDILMS